MTYFKIQTTWESFSHWLDKNSELNNQNIGIWRPNAAPFSRIEIYFAVTDPNLIDSLEGWEIAELPKAADNPDWTYDRNRWLFPGSADD